MKVDWKLMAEARDLHLSGSDLDRIARVLDALEAAFQPLTLDIPHNIEPATILSTAAVSAE